MAQTAAGSDAPLAPHSPSSTSPTRTHTYTTLSPRDVRKSSTSNAAPSFSSSETVPLDSPLRTKPIHPSLPNIRVPDDHATSNINPLTLQPFSDAELKSLGFEKLRSEYETTSGAIPSSGTGAFNTSASGSGTTINMKELEKAREEAVKMLKERIAEREAKEREIDREIDEKEKIREVERKVYRKKMAVGEGKKDGG